MLVWPGASDDELAFMRLVYDVHAEHSKANGAATSGTCRRAQLDPIEGREAQKDAAKCDARPPARGARASWPREGLADRYRIGITSAYRPATRQFEIWQGRTFDGKSSGGGFPYYYERGDRARASSATATSAGAAAEKVAEYLGGYIASPGYSNHQDGLAFDLGTGQVGKGLGKIGWTVVVPASGSRRTPARFHFYPLKTEAWHWTYHPPAGSSEAWEAEAAGRGAVSGGPRSRSRRCRCSPATAAARPT